MNKIAMYKEEIYKEARLTLEQKKELKTKMNDIDNEFNNYHSQVYPSFKTDALRGYISGAASGAIAGAGTGIALSKSTGGNAKDLMPLAAFLGGLGGMYRGNKITDTKNKQVRDAFIENKYKDNSTDMLKAKLNGIKYVEADRIKNK